MSLLGLLIALVGVIAVAAVMSAILSYRNDSRERKRLKELHNERAKQLKKRWRFR